ncbi:hypothetical protein D3C85_1514850 [compost metagenome]
MVLGDVVEMVGHRLAHIQAGIGLEIVENGGGECRVGLDSLQAKRPWQTRSAAFAGQAPDMFVGIQRPAMHLRQRGFQIPAQEVPDRELR